MWSYKTKYLTIFCACSVLSSVVISSTVRPRNAGKWRRRAGKRNYFGCACRENGGSYNAPSPLGQTLQEPIKKYKNVTMCLVILPETHIHWSCLLLIQGTCVMSLDIPLLFFTFQFSLKTTLLKLLRNDVHVDIYTVSVRTLQRTERLTSTKTTALLPCRDITGIYYGNHKYDTCIHCRLLQCYSREYNCLQRIKVVTCNARTKER